MPVRLCSAPACADIVQLPAIFHAQALNQANFVRYDEANTVFPTA